MSTRNYRMGARAQAVEDTRASILRAMIDLATERLTVDITLDDVAERSGVSVRTVLRQFGDRESLLDAAVEAGSALVAAERRPASKDADESVRLLLDHYELRGDFVLRLLAQEDDARIGAITAAGRLLHRDWALDAFERWLPPEPRERARLTDLVVVATDVYTWKLLRRDRGLSRAVTESRMRDLVSAVLPTDPFARRAAG